MSTKKGVYRSKKRKFCGNQWTKDTSTSGCSGTGIHSSPTSSKTNVGTTSVTNPVLSHSQSTSHSSIGEGSSASKRKLGEFYCSLIEGNVTKKKRDVNEEIPAMGTVFTDSSILAEIIAEPCFCSCGQKLELLELPGKRNGLATAYKLSCTSELCEYERLWHN